ncbi:MAG: GNAT family N-acetyltransferase [Mobilitalea sp.]
MDIINVNSSNIDQEHVCCANSDKKGDSCLMSRKNWMKNQFNDGLVFKKLNVNGKVFIEYIPAENAWCPIEAPGYLFIKCFWVSGQYKGKGYANALLEECIHDAKTQGKLGIVVLSSPKKMPFLSDPKYLKHKGFMVCDSANPHFELLYLPLTENVPKPVFKDCCKQGIIKDKGFVLYYSDQCPYAEKYSFLIAKAAAENGKSIELIKFNSKEEAQKAPSPFTTYSLFNNGKFITNEILTVAKFLKL